MTEEEIDMSTVEIGVDRLNELHDAEAFLDALEAAGVDNWTGYSDAVEIFKEGED